MIERRANTALPSVWTLAFVALATLFTVVAVRFSTRQSVWTDEATQLSGLSLGLIDQLRWLTGRLPHVFRVPLDRTPPLSYWLGSLWTHALGESVTTVRYLSVCLSVCSVAVLWALARYYFERRTALICAALLALSPNFIVEAAEIRPYAAFILFSILLICAYLRLLASRPSPSSLDFWAFALAALLCSYTHFFGIVISAGAFLCLLAAYLQPDSRPQRLRIVKKALWPLLFYSTSLVALFPFILSAVKNSGGGDLGDTVAAMPSTIRAHELVKLVYRFFGHQTMLGIPGLSTAAMLAGIALMLFATIPGANERARQLLLLLVVNLGLVTFIGLTIRAFNAFSSTYNAWALPVTALIAATAVAHKNRLVRAAGNLCIGVIITADCYGAARLATAGEIYAHTRSTVMQDAIDSAGSSNVIVVYANDASWSSFFALIYDYHAGLRQYIGRPDSVQMIGSPVITPALRLCDLAAGTLLVANDQELSADALNFLAAHPDVHTQAYHTLDDYLQTHHAELAGKWTLVSRNEYLAQTALALAIFKARTVDSQGDANCSAR